MKTRTALVIIILCLIAAAAVTYHSIHKKQASIRDFEERLSKLYYCEECDKEFQGKGGVVFSTCPYCGKETDVTRIRKLCKDCGNVFVQFEFKTLTQMSREPGTDDWGPGVAVSRPCPRCGSKNIVAYPESKQ